YAYRFERKTGQGDGSDSMYCPGAEIPNYSNLHNFEFTQEGLRAWKAFNVGPGKFIPWNDIVICPQRKQISWRRFHSSLLLLDSLHQKSETKQMPVRTSSTNVLKQAALKSFKVSLT
ncbi:hypothetical protein OS493_013649, partial [Desmophyllum pertusum]